MKITIEINKLSDIQELKKIMQFFDFDEDEYLSLNRPVSSLGFTSAVSKTLENHRITVLSDLLAVIERIDDLQVDDNGNILLPTTDE